MKIISHRGNLTTFQENSKKVMLRNWKFVPEKFRVGLCDETWQKNFTKNSQRPSHTNQPYLPNAEDTEIVVDWFENSIPAIDQAMRYCDMVEVDVWKINQTFYFGHDGPDYPVDYEYILNNIDKLLLHCKNMDALNYFAEVSKEFDKRYLHYFWHEDDDYTLTSLGYIITYPGKTVPSMGINMLPERNDWQTLQNNCWGVCTDNPFFLLGENHE